jgi:predicted nucleic acid-binding protein
MIVVADSSPLRYIVLIQEVHLLPILYGTIVLPPGVVGELTQTSSPNPVRLWMENLPPGLR